MTVHPTPHSTFTRQVEYRPPRHAGLTGVIPYMGGVLVLHLRSGRKLIYGEEHGVPPWLVGLLLSGSVGKAYNRLVREQYRDDYRSEDGPVPAPDYDSNPDRLTADLRASRTTA